MTILRYAHGHNYASMIMDFNGRQVRVQMLEDESGIHTYAEPIDTMVNELAKFRPRYVHFGPWERNRRLAKAHRKAARKPERGPDGRFIKKDSTTAA